MTARRADVAAPLSGTRVLDLTTVGPGARCAALLADLGAEVVRVGPPASAERIVPAAWAYGAGRGVRRIGIDLKDPRGVEACLRLAAGVDVVLEGFRPGVAARLGLGPDDVRAVNGVGRLRVADRVRAGRSLRGLGRPRPGLPGRHGCAGDRGAPSRRRSGPARGDLRGLRRRRDARRAVDLCRAGPPRRDGGGHRPRRGRSRRDALADEPRPRRAPGHRSRGRRRAPRC